MSDVVRLLARMLIAPMFLASGYGALSDLVGAAAYFDGLGLPFPTLVTIGTGLFELTAAAALVAGFQTRIFAALLAAFCLFATFIGHYGRGADAASAFTHGQMLLKDVAVAGGLIYVALTGAGPLSLDALIRRAAKGEPDR